MVQHGQIDRKFGQPRVSVEPTPEQADNPSEEGRVADCREEKELNLVAGALIRDAIADAPDGWIGNIAVPDSGGASVARRSLIFDYGDMTALPATVPPAFRRKRLVSVAGSSLFAELAVVRLFKLAGWTAYWRDGYGGGWVADGDLERSHLPQLPASLGSSVVADVTRARGGLSGCWDVVAWKANLVVFAECKRRRGDRLTGKQGRWLRSALDVGLPNEAFVVVEWDFASRPNVASRRAGPAG